MKSAHEDEWKRVALEHAADWRSEDAQLRAHMQQDYACKLVIEHRKWFTAVQGDPLHSVHQVPTYSYLAVGGQAQENSDCEDTTGTQWHHCPGAQVMQENCHTRVAGL